MIVAKSNKPARFSLIEKRNKFTVRIEKLLYFGTAFLLCFLSSCFQGSKKQNLPQPKAARRPVNQGVVIQTKAAIDYIEMVEPTLSEPEDIFPALTHALAAFYGWDDPNENPEEMFFFLKRLCRARMGDSEPACRDVRDGADALRKALYEDIIQVCEEMKKRNIPWKGGHSPQALAGMLRQGAERLPSRLSRLNKRWPRGVLPYAERCEFLDNKGVLLEIQENGVWTNGLLVARMEKGVFPESAAETLQMFLVTGMNVAAGKKLPVLVRADRNIPGETLKRILALSAEVNLRNVAVAVYKKGFYQYPCALQFRLRGGLIPPPLKTGFLEGDELVYYEGEARKILGVCNSEDGEGIKGDLFEGLTGVGIVNTSLSCFVEVVMNAGDAQGNKRVEVWLGNRAKETGDSGDVLKQPNLSGISGRGRFGMINSHHGP